MNIEHVLRAIVEANPTRHHDNLNRRIMKLMEELGEASEAYLNITSPSNPKGKSWTDVREELVDCVIVAVDCALTPTPDQEKMTSDDIEEEFSSMISRKLAKWARGRDTGRVATDVE
jgi:NTP pyrophosphatase (non-canonical NTP hydrolase)